MAGVDSWEQLAARVENIERKLDSLIEHLGLRVEAKPHGNRSENIDTDTNTARDQAAKRTG